MKFLGLQLIELKNTLKEDGETVAFAFLRMITFIFWHNKSAFHF